MNKIIEVISDNPGIKKNRIQRYTDMKYKHIEKSLKYLEVDGDIYVEKSKYYKTPKVW